MSAGNNSFICGTEKIFLDTCKGLPRYKQHDGKDYCVLHYPGDDKVDDFIEIYKHKIAEPGLFRLDSEDDQTEILGFDFRGVYFPIEIDFRKKEFNNPIYFYKATFCKRVSFSKATLKNKIYLNAAVFKDSLDFDFAKNDFGYFLILSFAEFTTSAKASFNTVKLYPSHFINVNPDKFNFTNVEWNFEKRTKDVLREIHNLYDRLDEHPHNYLSQACLSLAKNEEENYRFEEASKLRFMAFEAKRLAGKIRRTYSLNRILDNQQNIKIEARDYILGIGKEKDIYTKNVGDLVCENFSIVSNALNPLYLLYSFASKYGESVGRAFVVLIGIWFISALFFWFGVYKQENKNQITSVNNTAQTETTNSEMKINLSFDKSLIYSTNVLLLQKPEPKPNNTLTESVFILEMILGPIQITLLALAIRRRFMK